MPDSHIQQTAGMVLDAAGSVFFERELTLLQSRVYERRFPQFLALTGLLPVMTDGQLHTLYVEYETENQIGNSGYIGNMSLGGPRVDIARERRRTSTFLHGNSYGWDVVEISASQATGKRLDDRKAMASKRAHDQLTDQLAWLGDSSAGAVGLLNHPDVPRTISAGTFASLIGTPDNVLAELNDFVNGIVDLTNGVEQPDTLLLPVAQYNLIASTRLSTASDTTVLAYFLAHNPYIKTVRPVPRLNNAGAGSADVAVAYRNTMDNLALHICYPYTPQPPQAKGLTLEIQTVGRFGAVEIYYPLSVGVLEGI